MPCSDSFKAWNSGQLDMGPQNQKSSTTVVSDNAQGDSVMTASSAHSLTLLLMLQSGSKRWREAVNAAYEAQRAAKRASVGPATPPQQACLFEAPLTGAPDDVSQPWSIHDVCRVRSLPCQHVPPS